VTPLVSSSVVSFYLSVNNKISHLAFSGGEAGCTMRIYLSETFCSCKRKFSSETPVTSSSLPIH
jgi:hypothetical protein